MYKLISAIILFTVLNSLSLKAEKASYDLLENSDRIIEAISPISFSNKLIPSSYKFNFEHHFSSINYDYINIFKVKELVNVEEFILHDEDIEDYKVIKPVEFINEGTNLKFVVNIKKVCFQRLTFNMTESSVLDLNFLLNSDMEIIGKPILIQGDADNSNAVITMSNSSNKNTNKHKLSLYAINSELPTELKIENIELFIDKEIKFQEDKNRVTIKNSLIHGNINFRGIENIVLVNDSTFKDCKFDFYNENNQFSLKDVNIENSEYKFKAKDNSLKFENVIFNENSKVILESVNNTININSSFKGNIESCKNNLSLLFNNARVKNSVITLNNDNTLNFDNTTVSNSKITFNGSGNNVIAFNNTSNEGLLKFTNKGVNLILFAENGNNHLGGKIDVDNNSTVNFEFKSNSKTELNMSINGLLNEFNINRVSELILKNKEPININKFIYQGCGTIGIDLNNSDKFHLYIKEYQFNKDSAVNLKAYNISKLLSSENDEIVYKLLKSESDIDKTFNIKLNNNLLDYNIEIRNNEILLILKKNENKTIRELVKQYYKSGQSVFYEKDFLSLAEYLDILKNTGNCPQVDPLLDYIGNIELPNNSHELIRFLSNIFPISNNILYRASHDTTLSFLEEINSMSNNDRIYEPNIWSSVYHLDNNFTLGNSNTTNINLIGNGLATGVVYPVNKYFDVGASIGCNYNNVNNYTYNINLFSANIATHAKVFITNNLCNLSIMNFNLQNFDIRRNVIMYGYDSINSSSPLGKSLNFCNIFSYSLNLIDNKIIDFTIRPNLKFTLGKVLVSDYTETGKESLYIKGFDTFTSTTELSIYSSVGIKLEKLI